MSGKELRIFKYQLEIADTQEILVPKGARFLSLAVQNDRPVFYAAVDPTTTEIEKWRFVMRGTGHSIDEGTLRFAFFLGNVKTHNDMLVWHVWRT